ncbi:NTPase [Algoriphagus sp.]|uniref:NTPase n=1 Tax=Algoriphagus sp. TaxID=1872435 RepID=UPI002628277F|nr:NTPase [Algoriphagus sp.]
MKYFLWISFILVGIPTLAQGNLPISFFEGKSVVLISTDPSARPVMDWKVVADSVHQALVAAGGDPVAYYEIEQVALSEEVQSAYAKGFEQRMIKNILLVTRQKNQSSIHVGEFSGDGKIINSTSLFGVSGANLQEAKDSFAALGQNQRSKNLLVIDVPEFPGVESESGTAPEEASGFLARNPLNLDVFKLGIPIEGSSAQTGLLSYFRYDLFGRSQEAILAQQEAQKTQIQGILDQEYPYQVAWLTEAKSDEELVRDRTQFLLVRVEGRESDLKKSMGLESNPETQTQTVVKYYIKLIVRDELYIGPVWDADPDWRVALRNFLQNLQK